MTLNLTMRFNPHSLLGDTDPPDKHGHVNCQNDQENTADATAPVASQFNNCEASCGSNSAAAAEAKESVDVEDMSMSIDTNPTDDGGQTDDTTLISWA